MSQKSNFDEEAFDDAVTDLLICCEKVMETDEEYNINLQGENPIHKRLQKYVKIYDKSEPEDHVIYFRQIYNQHKRGILKGPRNPTWLTQSSVTIQFGSEIGQKNDFKLHLSSIYNIALRVRDKVQETMEGLPDMEQNTEILLPNMMLYYLYNIFSLVINKKTDRKRLLNFKKDMAKEVGIRTGNTSNPMNGLMSYMKGAAESLGLPIPDDMKLPDGEQIGDLLKGLADNPKAKSLMNNLKNAAQQGKGMQEIISQAAEAIGDIAGDDAVSSLLGGGQPQVPSELVPEGVPISNDEFAADEYLDE